MPSSFEPSDATDSSSAHYKQGRPTKQVHLSIHESMQKCFESGISAPSAARLLKVNVKTAYRHYNEITTKSMEKNYDDMLERERKERVQIIGTFDKDIIELTDLLDRVKDEIQTFRNNNMPVPPLLTSQLLSIIRSRFVVKEKKYAYIIRPMLKELYKQESGEPDDKP